MTGPALSPVGVVHVEFRVGPPTASQVKLRGIPWETAVEGQAVTFTIIGATTEEEGNEEREGVRIGGKGGDSNCKAMLGSSKLDTVSLLNPYLPPLPPLTAFGPHHC